MAEDRKTEHGFKEGRRGFLKFAGLGTVASGAALVSGKEVQAGTVEQGQTSGYRETDHVRAYYKAARF